jgi:MFS family permease
MGEPSHAPSRDDSSGLDPFAITRIEFQISAIVTAVGSSMAALATAFVVYDRSRSVMATAMIMVLGRLPVVVLAPMSTALLERFGPARIVLVASITRFVLTLFPVALAIGGGLDVASLLAWQFALGIVHGVSGASTSSLTRQLAAPGRIPEFNAQLGRSRAIAALIGLLIGGVVLGRFGAAWVFGIDAISFLGAPIVLVPVLSNLGSGHDRPRRLREGFATIRADDRLRAAMVVAGIMAFFAAPIGSLLPAIAHRVGSGSHLLSFLMAAFACGGLFVALLMRILHDRSRWSVVSRVSSIIAGLGLVIIGITEWAGGHGSGLYVLVLVALIPVGLSIAILGALLNGLVQMGAPTEVRSPVLTAYGAVLSVAAPISGVVIGLIADVSAVWVPLLLLGVSFEALALLGTQRRLFRRLEDLDPEMEDRARSTFTVDPRAHLHLHHLGETAIEVVHPPV